MESFRWIVPVFSIILGLGITRVLTGLLEIFRARAHAQLDWVPIAWALGVFVAQLQLWWAIIELAGIVKVWTPGDFLLLISLPLLLFLAAALILPSERLPERASIRDTFRKDGRWGLVALSLYMLLAIFADARFWKVPFWSREAIMDLGLAVLPLCLLLSKSRRVEVFVTVAFAVLYAATAIEFSPPAYR